MVWDGLGYHLEISHGRVRPFVGGAWEPLTDHCPIKPGDTIAVVCPECDGRGWIHRSVRWDESGREWCPKECYGHEIAQLTAREILGCREQDGAWWWVVETEVRA